MLLMLVGRTQHPRTPDLEPLWDGGPTRPIANIVYRSLWERLRWGPAAPTEAPALYERLPAEHLGITQDPTLRVRPLGAPMVIYAEAGVSTPFADLTPG